MHSTTSHALPSSALMCGSGHIQSWCSSQIVSLFVCECKVTVLLVGLENPHKNPRFEWHSTLHIYWIHFHVDYCVLCSTIIQHSNSWKRFAEFNHFWKKMWAGISVYPWRDTRRTRLSIMVRRSLYFGESIMVSLYYTIFLVWKYNSCFSLSSI